MRKEFRDLFGPQEFQRLIDGLDCEVSTEKLEIKKLEGGYVVKTSFHRRTSPLITGH